MQTLYNALIYTSFIFGTLIVIIVLTQRSESSSLFSKLSNPFSSSGNGADLATKITRFLVLGFMFVCFSLVVVNKKIHKKPESLIVEEVAKDAVPTDN